MKPMYATLVFSKRARPNPARSIHSCTTFPKNHFFRIRAVCQRVWLMAVVESFFSTLKRELVQQ